MDDETLRPAYDLSGQGNPSTADATTAQPLTPLIYEEPTSVFQVGASPWMRRPVQPSPSPTQIFPLGEADRPDPPELANMNIITQEEKEEVKNKRIQQRVKDELDERRLREREERDLRLCRKYFIVGCFGLPFLLWVNVIYFLRELKASGNFRVRKYVWLSLMVALVETFLWILWFVVFQLLRDSTLGALGITRHNTTTGRLV